MIFLDLLALCACIIMLSLMFTQMIQPVMRGTKLFPMFRKEQKLKEEIVNLNQKIIEKDLEQKIKTIKKEKGVK